MKEHLNVDDISRVLENKGYVLFDDDAHDYNLNIVGVRTKTNIPEAFDDYIFMFWKKAGQWTTRTYYVTTDPGIFYLNYPLNTLGTAILKEGQYRSCYKVGLHKGQYTALVQRKEVTVLRDIDRNDMLDIEDANEYTGFFGINIHRSFQTKRAYEVNKWSAGCTVFADPDQYAEFITLCQRAMNIWGNSFTYTLLHENDFAFIDDAADVDPIVPAPVEPVPSDPDEPQVDDVVDVEVDRKPKTNPIAMFIRSILQGIMSIFG